MCAATGHLALWTPVYSHYRRLAHATAARWVGSVTANRGTAGYLNYSLDTGVCPGRSNMMHRHADVAVMHGYTNALQAWQGSNKEHAFPQVMMSSTLACWLGAHSNP